MGRLGLVIIRAVLGGANLRAAGLAADSLSVKGSDRNVMLNAESATAPRVLNIGLPESTSGAVVFVDGMKAAQGLPRSYFHWAGGNAYKKTATISLMESVIRTGEISAPVDSWTKLGGDSHEGAFSARSSSNGLIRLDLWEGGPIKGDAGWYYSVGAYVNYDPTNVNSPSCPYVDRKQIYQFAVSRKWRSSEFSFLYRFSWCGDHMSGIFNTTPFTYNGDGSVTIFKGFRMGYDCYFPADDKVDYMDLVSGKTASTEVNRMNDRRFHDISALWKTHTEKGWDLRASWHLLLMPRYRQANGSLNGTDLVTEARGFTYPDGKAYSGYVQNRLIKMEDMSTYDVELLLEAEKQFAGNRLHTGISSIYADQYEAASSLVMAHTVEANPERLYLNGRNSWNYNRNALYFDAHKFGFAAFVFDDWSIASRLHLLSGLRFRPVFNNVHTLARLNGEEKNRRVEGFNMADPSLAEMHSIHLDGIDYAVSESLNWGFGKGFNAVAEGFYSITNKSTTYFRNSTIPSTKAIGNALVRGGLMYANSWLDVTGALSYITSWNNANIQTVTKQIGGVSETIPWTAQYGIGTKGITLDGNVFSGGFRCHVLFTWQDPRYHNYTNDFVFSDGSHQLIDYTDKFVTGISRIMIEFDPSYKWRNLRAWGSARYYSRQYASRTNYAYFDGRIETFAGADWYWRERLTLSLSLVNLLNQGGVKGSVDIADTIDDPSALEGYVMAGTFIRPFSVELSVSYKF